ncbi:MAG: hypothetical protein ACK4NY_17785 [Spirosomataceae bacterium]
MIIIVLLFCLVVVGGLEPPASVLQTLRQPSWLTTEELKIY